MRTETWLPKITEIDPLNFRAGSAPERVHAGHATFKAQQVFSQAKLVDQSDA